MKNLFAVIFALCTMLSVALPTHAGPGRPSFSSRPSYSGGFRSSSSSSYRSFSPSPSRTFTYKSSVPSYSAPAAAPRSYSYSAPTTTIARPVSRSTTKTTVVNNHYHGDAGRSSGGGLSMTDYLVLHSLTNQNNGPTYVNTQPAPSSTMVVDRDYEAPAVIYQHEESHFWRNLFLGIGGIIVLAGAVAAFVHWLELDED